MCNSRIASGYKLNIDDKLYIANVGDSRAILSSNKGSQVMQITMDHKPNEDTEKVRILNFGGKIYKTKFDFPIQVPYRVFPGRLSVSRTIGDVEAKYAQFNGNPNVVIAKPDIYELTVTKSTDFLFIGCDGIFDEVSNKEIVDYIWQNRSTSKQCNEQAADAVDSIIKLAAYRKSFDNLTGIIILFDGYLESRIENANSEDALSDKLRRKSSDASDLHSIGKGINGHSTEADKTKKLFSWKRVNNMKFPKIVITQKLPLILHCKK
jgi:protein phosphatase 2C family protein 2/3